MLRHAKDWRLNPYKRLHVATNPSLADVCANLVWQAVSVVLQNVDEGQETDGLQNILKITKPEQNLIGLQKMRKRHMTIQMVLASFTDLLKILRVLERKIKYSYKQTN